jgi:OmpA-OmpF porin, OOP family
MTSNLQLGLLTMAALSALCSAPALAQDDSHYYLGIGVGQARARLEDRLVSGSLGGSGLATTMLGHDERHSAYKVFGGYQFNRNWGVELGYFHLGRFGIAATTTPTGTLNGEFRVQGVNVDVVGTLPFTNRFSGLARLGAQYARTRTSLVATGDLARADTNPSDREANVKFGLGLQYAFSSGFQMRAEVERFRVSDALGNHPHVAMYSVSAVFPFGRAETPVRRVAALPMEIPPAPAPAPTLDATPVPIAKAAPPPVEAPAPMPARRVSYEAASLFAFDRAELLPAGRQALDSFIEQLRGINYENVTVQGFTDRLGSTAYNQTLSQARADAVKAYLVKQGGLHASKIVAVGRSESLPVTSPGACEGLTGAALLACLAPDRRVELEVAGSR